MLGPRGFVSFWARWSARLTGLRGLDWRTSEPPRPQQPGLACYRGVAKPFTLTWRCAFGEAPSTPSGRVGVSGFPLSWSPAASDSNDVCWGLSNTS